MVLWRFIPALCNNDWEDCEYFDFSMEANTSFSFLFFFLGVVVEDSGPSKVGDKNWKIWKIVMFLSVVRLGLSWFQIWSCPKSPVLRQCLHFSLTMDFVLYSKYRLSLSMCPCYILILLPKPSLPKSCVFYKVISQTKCFTY